MTRRMVTLRSLVGMLILPLAFAAASAPPLWRVDAAQSRLGFTAIQAGAEFDGVFNTFYAVIRFDPKDLANSLFRVEVNLASVDTQADDRDDILRSPDMFDTAQWPMARFETTGFSHKGGHAYEAEGRLTLREVTRPIRVPFTFESYDDGNRKTARLRGGVGLRRLDYGVGRGELEDTTWVGNDVRVKFHLYLKEESRESDTKNPA